VAFIQRNNPQKNMTILHALRNLVRAALLALILASSLIAQNTRVDVGKHSRIPRICEGLTPAQIDGTVDLPALVKEAMCKGAGDMLGEYTFTVNSVKLEKNKKGRTKEETYVYEVFIPTLKSGTRTRGVLIVTSHNGVAVPTEKLQKERERAAEKIEKEEEKIARTPTAPEIPESEQATGMKPLGMYGRSSITRSAFGIKSGGVTLGIAGFLETADLTFVRREQVAGRETLIFNFTPRAGTQFIDNEKYIAQLTGEIWIDAADRIVTRLIGWPPVILGAANGVSTGERPPAILMEMMRLPQQGIWLPRVIRINGADYQTLFDGIKTDSTRTYSNYFRFATEVKDAQLGPTTNP